MNSSALSSEITLSEKLVFIFIGVNTYAMSIFPFSNLVFDTIFYFQYTLFAIFLIVDFKIGKFLNLRISLKRGGNKLLLFLLSAFIFSSLIVNSNNHDIASIVKLFAYIIVFYLFFVYLSGIFYFDIEKFNKFLNVVVILAVINSIFGFFSLFVGFAENKATYGYLTGFLYHPNSAGFVYSISIPIVFYNYFEKKISFYTFALIAGFLFIALLYTFSRSAYIAAIISVLLLIYFKSKKALVLSIIAFVLMFFLVIGDFLASKGGLSSVSRLLLFYTAFDMITSGTGPFLWGYGIIKSLEIFTVERLFFGSFENVIDPHNFILLLGIQFGMVMTFVYILFITTILISAQLYKKYLSPEKRRLSELSFSLIIGLLIQNMFEDIIVYPEFFLFPIFLVFLGYLNNSMNSVYEK